MAKPKLSPEQQKAHDKLIARLRIKRRRRALRQMWIRSCNR